MERFRRHQLLRNLNKWFTASLSPIQFNIDKPDFEFNGQLSLFPASMKQILLSYLNETVTKNVAEFLIEKPAITYESYAKECAKSADKECAMLAVKTERDNDEDMPTTSDREDEVGSGSESESASEVDRRKLLDSSSSESDIEDAANETATAFETAKDIAETATAPDVDQPKANSISETDISAKAADNTSPKTSHEPALNTAPKTTDEAAVTTKGNSDATDETKNIDETATAANNADKRPHTTATCGPRRMTSKET